MSAVTESPDRSPAMAALLERLGGIAPRRVRLDPTPGNALEQDVLSIEVKENRLFELVDGTLVEKGMGFYDSLLAGALLTLLNNFVVPRNLGLVTGADGMIRLFPGQVRIPDVAFISWGRIPGGRIPREPIPTLVPDLTVEVLSDSNTPLEMLRKRQEYFRAGVQIVWEIDPMTRTVASYTAPETSQVLGKSETLDGGHVLPGFSLSLKTLFAELDRHAGEAR